MRSVGLKFNTSATMPEATQSTPLDADGAILPIGNDVSDEGV